LYLNIGKIAERVASLMSVEASDIWAQGKDRSRVAARSLLCYWAVRDLLISMAQLSRRLHLSISGISLSVKRGEKIARDTDCKLI